LKSKKKKIVFFDCALHFGGSKQNTLLLARELQNYCEVYIVDAYGTCPEYLQAIDQYGLQRFIVQPEAKKAYIGGTNSFDRICRVIGHTGQMFYFVKQLRQVLAEISPQVISVNAYKSLFYVARATKTDIPITYYVRLEGEFPRWYVRRDWKNLCLITGVSKASLSRLHNSSYQFIPMEVIPNGIDVDEIVNLATSSPKSDLDQDGLKIIIPASLNPNKSQHIAIEGLARYLDQGGKAFLWLCGDCPPGTDNTYAENLPKLADNLGISKYVHFLGWRKDIPSLMMHSDIVALTSRSESFGRIFIEAMCLQKPILATRTGGIPEVVRDEIEGLLIDVDDSDGFARALSKLSSSETRKQMGQQGFERVKSHFDIKVVARQYYEAISKYCCNNS